MAQVLYESNNYYAERLLHTLPQRPTNQNSFTESVKTQRHKTWDII